MSVPLAFRGYGDGSAMVILHGLFGSAQNWHSMADRLADARRVVACDLRNHGDSPWADAMTFADMADDLEALIEAHDLAPAIVVGHSVGGKTAMLAALRRPALIESLVVVDIAPVEYVEPFLDYVTAMQAVDLAGIDRRSEVDAELALVVRDPATRAFLLQNLVERDGRLAWRLNLDAIEANMPALLGFPSVAALAFEGRALFVSGADSDYIGQTYHNQIYDLFPQAEFARIEGAGHYPHVEQPERFATRLLDFLDSAYA